MVDEGERESNGGSAESCGGVVDRSGDGVNGFAVDAVNGSAIVVENDPIEVEKGGVGSVYGSAIEVENGAVDAVHGLTIDPENDPIEVEKWAVGSMNGSAIEVENGAVDAVHGLAIDTENDPLEVGKGVVGSVNMSTIEVENGAVDAVHGLENNAGNDPIEVDNGGDKAANGFATEAVNGAVVSVNGLASNVENNRIEVGNGADKVANGFANEAENGVVAAGNGVKTEVETWAVGDGNSAGSSCEGLRTYKRRRLTKMASLEIKLPEDGNVSADSVSRLPDKSIEEPFQGVQQDSSREQFNRPRIVSRTAMSSDGCPLNHWTKVVLEQICQSLRENEGGLHGCIQQALLSHPESSCTSAAKASVHSSDDNHKCPSQKEWIANAVDDASRGNVNLTSKGTLSESSCMNADGCRRAFLDIVASEKFAELCGLLLENFQGIKVDSFLDISLINSRMKEGAYESSHMLFNSDMQQLWTKLQYVGAELVALGKCLSDKSRISYQEQFPTVVSDSQAKPEQTEACGVDTVRACHRCGEISNVRDSLVCDSCEKMYHVSCIEPAVEEIPSKSWYCAKCTADGIEPPHDDCVVCEKLNASRNGDNEIEENSNGLSIHGVPIVEEGETCPHCNVCGNEVDNGDRFMVCGHPFCLHKYYHVKCLTNKQIKTCGPHWYCPSCLCRVCLTDCDDEKIVLCDGCDNAYHIYCMRPSRSSIPRGKWFCRKCDVGIQRIRKAKKAYLQKSKLKQREGDKEGAFENLQIDRKESDGNNSGGVDMLLTAAKTLNFEEKMAGVKMKS